MPDPIGFFVGWLSIMAILYLFKYCDDLSDGNVGEDA